jgi:hypothetical protein
MHVHDRMRPHRFATKPAEFDREACGERFAESLGDLKRSGALMDMRVVAMHLRRSGRCVGHHGPPFGL